MNQQETLKSVVAGQLKSEGETPYFTIGDTLNVHVRIIEGDKERIQVYQGVLIAQKGSGANHMITVRRIVANEGVERIFPVHSPRIAQIEVATQVLTPVNNPEIEAQLVQRQSSGTVRFDIAAGRIRAQQRGLKHVQGWEKKQAARAKRGEKKAKPIEEETGEE